MMTNFTEFILLMCFIALLVCIIPALAAKPVHSEYKKYWDNWKGKGGSKHASGMDVRNAYEQDWSEEKIRNWRAYHELQEGSEVGWNDK